MTSFLDAVVALIVAGIVNLVIVNQIWRRIPGPEGGFLGRVYTWTILLRFALAIFLNANSGQSRFADTFWGDSAQYDVGGWLEALRWNGDVVVNNWVAGKVSGWGFFYFVAAIYWVFGHNQLLAQLFNATIGSVTVLVIYALAKEMFDVEIAQWTARFMAFFPGMIFWSGAIYKDPAIMLCIAMCMYAVVKLNRTFAVRYVVVFVAASLALMTLRFYVFYFVAFATLGTFVVTQRRGLVGNVFVYGVLTTTFVGAFSLAASRDMVEQQRSYFDLQKIQTSRLDLSTSAQSGYESRQDVSTTRGALAALPKGLLYLLFAPFPWSTRGLRQALTVPETLVWYALWPSLFRGLGYTIRHRMRDALPILVFAAALTFAYAIFQGNIGTAYRQRNQVTMFYFIFMAAGLVLKRRTKARPQPQFAAPVVVAR